MDKNAIKKFAVWARRELISRVSQRAAWYGITEKDPIDDKATVIHGKVMTENELAQRRALIARICSVGYQQVMEEVAYTWFNRFIALRFMEVNGYLPSYTRVFTDDSGAFNPQILKDAIHLDLDGLDMEKVYALEEADETEALFKYLVITQCNDLNRMLPGMFQKIADYTELLFPDFLLREGSVAHQMVTTIPEEDWKDAVQIIGWMYQYYNAEPKDEVFAALKKNIKISKEKIPAATQLFTPDWIVRYMVENSLGRLWVEGHPNEELKASWKYYLEEAPQEPEVEQQLTKIRAEYAQIDPASILCADPCMGSGHILVYMFDVLMQIYLSYGYTTNEAVESIVRNNLWGMDIDDRAAQLAYFAVMMKAQQYDHRWLAKQLRNPVQPNVFALQDSGDWSTFELWMRQAFTHHPSLTEDASIRTAKKLFYDFADAKEYGSIIQPKISLEELNILENTLDDMAQKADLMDFVAQADAITLMETLRPLIRQCRGLVQKYNVVVTNPPYMGNGNLDDKISDYIKAHYIDGRNDLFSVFIMRCMEMCGSNAYQAMITQHQWMFLSSYTMIREKMRTKTLVNMAHLGARAFDEISGEVVQTTSFVLRNTYSKHYISFFSRLVDEKSEAAKGKALKEPCNIFKSCVYTFGDLPGTPYVYWIGEKMKALFNCPSADDVISLREGIHTGQNDLFLRFWSEIEIQKLVRSAHSENDVDKEGVWVPYNKGGSYRKWYGNNDLVIGFDKKHRDAMAALSGHVRPSQSLYFKSGGTWSALASGKFGLRYYPEGFLFDSKGQVAVGEKSLEIISLFNLKAYQILADMLMPTLDYKCGDVKKLPYCHMDNPRFIELGKECIEKSKEEYDSFETSWDFKQHPFVWYSRGLWDATNIAASLSYFYGENPQTSCPLETCWLMWQGECNERFKQLKANEEEMNRLFIEAYDLQDELTPDVNDKDITIRKADLSRDIRSLVSYAVGCMLGRYSLDNPGLAFAGGTWDESLYVTYPADHDGILPITDDEYFDDDIVGMFIDWVRTVFGAETLEANLKFIANALGGKDNPREVIRQYFLNDFYKDHLKTYQKRPIYWLFDSGKKNGFKCLIYMHRYQPDTIARIRTDYVHETQARYRTAIETLERESANASTGERVKLQKHITNLKAQAEELRVYEEKIHHLADQMIPIDLDDGVKVNYAKFADVLAPIK